MRELLVGIKNEAEALNQAPQAILSQSQSMVSQYEEPGKLKKDLKQEPQIIEQILNLFKKDINPPDLEEAKKEISESIEAISKASLMELRALAKPHPLIEKCLQIVLALRGYKQLHWNNAKEFLNKPSIKVELMQTQP